jgi:hypothetical protein
MAGCIDKVDFFQCRHYMECLTNCLQFWLSSSVAVSLIQLVAIVSLLPPLFTIGKHLLVLHMQIFSLVLLISGQILWLQCIVIPILSLSLVGKPTDAQIMQKATGKNQFSINFDVSIHLFLVGNHAKNYTMKCSYKMFQNILHLCYLAKTFSSAAQK